jgi:hypothetical protein
MFDTVLLWKESLKTNGQQFHQCQQNQQSLLTFTHWPQKTTTYDVGNPSQSLGQGQ